MVERQPPAKKFEDLSVWQKAHAFVLGVYRYSTSFPKSETYGLVSQLRRAAVSVPANVAEGFKRRKKPEKVRFLNIAQGSLEEARYFLILARDLRYGDYGPLMSQLEEIARMLERYTQRIEASIQG
jgi:four helix bundle protein